ncbi:hypothetical protein [Chryseobacterium joostei]|uniref:hypothetical protein n=1 Tax=Chryseobacterium joostei TaxID=112234 RepID=UPI003D0FFA8F
MISINIRFIVACLLGLSGSVYSQVGLNTAIPHPSSILEMSSTNKGFSPPKVQLSALNNSVLPINNPAEGLIVYNENGGALPHGYYIWSGGVWNLLAAYENSLLSTAITNTTSTDLLNSTSESIITGGSIIFNSIPNITYNAGTGEITLPVGKYSIFASFDIATGETTGSPSLGNVVKANTHAYIARITNLSGSLNYGKDAIFNSVSNTSGTKKHIAEFSFSISVPSTGTVVLRLLRNPNNSTYAGKITTKNTFIHIQTIL